MYYDEFRSSLDFEPFMLSDELKQLGNTAFANKEFKKAAKIYRDAIKLDPTNPILYSNRAICFIKLQDWERALRDCSYGLTLEPELKTKVKLLYRKGLVLRNTSQMSQAKRCFEQVLEIDAHNESALNELKTMDTKKHKSNITDVPISSVDELPMPFKQLITCDVGSVETEEKLSEASDAKINHSEELKRAAEELFPESDKPKESGANPKKFADLPSMLPLNALKNFSGERLAKGYVYVLNIPVSNYEDIFSTGIDPEFLDFFLEASIYAAQHHHENWELKVSERFVCFSKMKKFSLSLMMCSPSSIQQLLGLVQNNSELHRILSNA